MSEWVVYAALVSSMISLLATSINIFWTDSQKRKTKSLEITIARCDEQIGKFYAPLANLVEQLDATDDFKIKMTEQDPQHAEEIAKITYDNYFQPIHKKISEILERNMHLIEGDYIPQTFIDYYRHVASERVFFSLIENLDKAKRDGTLPQEASNVSAKPYPYPEPQFKIDIQTGFKAALERQERALRLLDDATATTLKTWYRSRSEISR